MSDVVKVRDPVFLITFKYLDHKDQGITYIRAVRAPNEMNARIWVQQLCATDCKRFGDLNIYKSATLQFNEDIPHINDLTDITKEILHKTDASKIYGPYSNSLPKKEESPPYSLNTMPWAIPFYVLPGKGLGTTKTSNKESFYDVAEGALEL